MTKDKVLKARVAESMYNKVMAEAARRDKNQSEFIRFVLDLFFEHTDDSNRQSDEEEPCQV